MPRFREITPLDPADGKHMPLEQRKKALTAEYLEYREEHRRKKLNDQVWPEILPHLMVSNAFFYFSELTLQGTARLGHAVFTGIEESAFLVTRRLIYSQVVTMEEVARGTYELYLRSRMHSTYYNLPGRINHHIRAWKFWHEVKTALGRIAIMLGYRGTTEHSLADRNAWDIPPIVYFYLDGATLSLHHGAIFSSIHHKVVDKLRELDRNGFASFRIDNAILWDKHSHSDYDFEPDVDLSQERDEQDEEEGGDHDDDDSVPFSERHGSDAAKADPEPPAQSNSELPSAVDPIMMRGGLPMLFRPGMTKADRKGIANAVFRIVAPHLSFVAMKDGVPVVEVHPSLGSQMPSVIRCPLASKEHDSGYHEGWSIAPARRGLTNSAYAGLADAFENPVPVQVIQSFEPLLNPGVRREDVRVVLYQNGEINYRRTRYGRRHMRITDDLFRIAFGDNLPEAPRPLRTVRDLASLPARTSSIHLIGAVANTKATSFFELQPFPGCYLLLAFVMANDRPVLLTHAPSLGWYECLDETPKVLVTFLYFLELYQLTAASAAENLPLPSTIDDARTFVLAQVKSGFDLSPDMLDCLMGLGTAWAIDPRNIVRINSIIELACGSQGSTCSGDQEAVTQAISIKGAAFELLNRQSNVLSPMSAWSREDPMIFPKAIYRVANSLIPRANSRYDSLLRYNVLLGTGDSSVFFDDNFQLRETSNADTSNLVLTRTAFSVGIKQNKIFVEDTKARLSIPEDHHEEILANTLCPTRLGRPLLGTVYGDVYPCDKSGCTGVFNSPQQLADHTCSVPRFSRKALAASQGMSKPAEAPVTQLVYKRFNRKDKAAQADGSSGSSSTKPLA